MSNKLVVIANTHIACAYSTPAKQLAQVAILLKQLEKVTTATREANGGIAPAVVLTGDFNSTPMSGCIQFIKNGSLEKDHADRIADEGAIAFPFETLSHSLGLRSAYESVLGIEPAFTNVTHRFAGTLDYIFHSKAMIPLCVRGLPSLHECRAEKGLPNLVHPSDHLPIAATFQLS
jgi:mRNA deadenylase 3'-5' endonuclease subunit Ccr4